MFPSPGSECEEEGNAETFAGILPALSGVKVVRHYAGESGWIAAQAEIALSNGKTLCVLDAFHVQKGEIVEQQNHYDSRPATG